MGDKIIGESQNYLCIPSYNVTSGKPRVFKKDFGTQINTDDKARYVDIALATSAAPTFFPMAEIPHFNNEQFVDGGVWANNPTLMGLIEALRFFIGNNADQFSSINILSVSSLSLTAGKPTGLKRSRPFYSWRQERFETSMNGQNYFTEYFMKLIDKLGDIPIQYTRIPTATVST